MAYEVVATGRDPLPAKNKTEARKLLADVARDYRLKGWTLHGNAQQGAYVACKDEERHGLIVRPWL